MHCIQISNNIYNSSVSPPIIFADFHCTYTLLNAVVNCYSAPPHAETRVAATFVVTVISTLAMSDKPRMLMQAKNKTNQLPLLLTLLPSNSSSGITPALLVCSYSTLIILKDFVLYWLSQPVLAEVSDTFHLLESATNNF